MPLWAILVLITCVYACSIYVNLSFAVRNSADYRFFPPFQRHVNANYNDDLAAENFNIAKSLVAGKGFAHPFPEPSGPTAWMGPALPGIEAGLLRLCAGKREAVSAAVVFLQINVLMGTGLLVLALILKTTRRIGVGLALAAFFVGLLHHFSLCFQLTQDCWLVLLAVDLVIAGLCCWRPLGSRTTAVAWGLVGGFCTLVNPIVGFTWAVLSLLVGLRRGLRS
ncbi:MAG TPA: hypothetical protein VGY58_01095, partial [Gemmataceae bacterium]|nr:hypothetical protein [Gemmataceae bacterium]